MSRGDPRAGAAGRADAPDPERAPGSPPDGVRRTETRAAARWIRHRPDARTNRAALAAGLGVGLLVGGVVFYVARLIRAREPLAPVPRGAREAR